MPVRSHLPDDVDSRYLGQSEVDDCEIDRVFAGEVQPFLAIGCLLDGKSLFLKSLCERLKQRRVIFDYEQAHDPGS